MIRFQHVILAATVFITCACSQHKQMSRPLGNFAREIISDKENIYNNLLDNACSTAYGEITIIGDETSALKLAEDFASTDLRDNGNADRLSDQLADFAGEVISCIIDTTHTPFYRYDNDSKEFLSEILIRHTIAAMDTVVHISPYDLDGIGSKAASKIIIVTDPYLADYGLADADSLLNHFRCNVPVISPMDVMFEEIASSDKHISMVGVLCAKEFASSGIYSGRLKQICRKYGRNDIDCVVIPSDGSLHTVRNFLDTYINIGISRPLDAILIDLVEADISNIKTELADLMSLMNVESMTYRKYISDDFIILESYSSVIDKCYDLMREKNMFSHRIIPPMIATYYNIPAPASIDGSFILIPGTYVQN